MVGGIGGAQAQLMSAAEMQIAVRVDCTTADVRKALWTDRSLVKTWLMRGTLHLARAGDLPVYTAAMSRRWIKVSNAWLKFVQVTEPELWKLVDDIGAALDGKPLSREELIAIVGKGKPARITQALRSGWGGMLKPAARNGRLCFGPNRGQNVTFVNPKQWLHDWHDVDPEQAIVEAARRYLRGYGPATKQDFSRWWGNWPGPLFDPYLMGYATRDHLFDRVHAPKVSRTAGWISAVVLVDGVVAGTWTHTTAKGGKLRIEATPFQRLTSAVTSEVRKRADELAKAVDATRVEVVLA